MSETYLGGRPLRRYLTWYGVASFSLLLTFGSIMGILLPNHVQALEFARWFTGPDAGVDLAELSRLKDAVAGGATATAEEQRLLGLLGRFDAGRAQALSLVTSLGLAGTMLAVPVIGILSDRTRSRHGRRTPWILLGVIVGAVFLAGVRFAPSIAVLALLWTICQVGLSAAQGPLNTTVADRVPQRMVGTASAVGGLGTFLGGILGAVLCGALFARLGLDLYLVVAVLTVAGLVGFVLRLPDRPSTELRIAPHRWSDFLRGFLAPLREHDFRWVWLARVVLAFGYQSSVTFSFFMLQSYIRPALSAAEATGLVPLLTLAGLPGTLVALAVSGRISDKVGRRKPFVVGASLLMAGSMLIPLLSPTLTALFVQTVLGGIANGMYLAVDQALFIDVLDKDAAGRDLGVASLATNLGQALGPILAGQVVVLTGGYGGIWALAFVLILLAAVAIVPVKRVR
ncbi:MFS transporter [Nonomuraea rosea]|uniref:MFS transporter n=2 Tax=Nonomuraea rosea TaxID=638574 RepID=A0ABP6ZCV7_9ACTN